MNREAVVAEFVDRFPVLRAPTDEFFTEWGPDDGLFVWVDVLFRFVLWPLLDAEREDPQALRAVFDAMESLAGRVDGEIDTFVATGILEVLADSESRLRRAWPYMQPRTRGLLLEIETFLGRSHPELWGPAEP